MQELVKACQTDNIFAQRRLYETYARQMFRLCMRYIANNADAEEVVMDGFLKIFEAIKKFDYRDERSFEAWLKRIMVNESLVFLRKERQAKIIIVSTDDSEIVGDDYNDIVANCDAEVLFNMICQLPVGYRMVLNLFAIEGYSHEEIAKQLNISVGTSKSQLNKARTLLRKHLNRDERTGTI